MDQFVPFKEQLDPENLLYNTTISILGDSLTKIKVGDIFGWSTVMKNEAFQSCIQQTTEGGHRENFMDEHTKIPIYSTKIGVNSLK